MPESFENFPIQKQKKQNQERKTPEEIIVANLKKALKQGADKYYIADSLAGVGTPEAMQMRRELMEQGASKNYIAWGLAGVNTKEAEEFRS